MVQSNKVQILLELKDDATRGMKSATKAVQDHSETFRKASFLMAGATAVLGSALFFSIRAGRDYGNAMDQLKGAISRAGGDFDVLKDRIDDGAEALADATDFTKTDAIEALRGLVDATGDVGTSMDDMWQLTLDVASQRGVGVETAVRNVVNAVTGGRGELVENFSDIRGAFESIDDPAVRMEFLLKKFGGAAEANADPINVLTSAIKDFVVNLGVTEEVNSIAKAIKAMGDILSKNLSSEFLKAFGSALLIVFGTLTIGVVVAGAIAIGAAIGAIPIAIGLAVGAVVIGVTLIVSQFSEMVEGLKGYPRVIGNIFGSVKDTVEGIVGSFVKNIAASWSTLASALNMSAFVQDFIDGWVTIIDGGKTFIGNIASLWSDVFNAAINDQFVQDILKFWNRIFSNIQGFFRGAGSFLKDAWNNIWSTFKDDVSTVFGLVFDAVKFGVNKLFAPLNMLIRALNKIQVTVPDIKGLPFRGMTMGVNIPDIPALARGGIVTRPTLGLIGESGPEAVIPLNGRAGAGGAAPTIVVNLPASSVMVLDSEASTRRLATEITKQIRDVLRGQRAI